MSSHHRKDARADLNQRELDVLKVLAPVREGQRSQAEAARLLGITPRHVRRLLRCKEPHPDRVPSAAR